MAAGSLQAAENAMADQYLKVGGTRVNMIFGPSGLLRERVEKGEAVDVLASADMDQPNRLVSAGWAGFATPFARNSLCLFTKPGLSVESAAVLDRMLDPKLTLATSTPKADPAGDYTWAAFAKAGEIHPGAFATLDGKAKKIFGGPQSQPVPQGRNMADFILAGGQADLLVSYCSGAAATKAANPAIGSAEFPDNLRADALYGLAVRKGAPTAALDFALFHLSTEGRRQLSLAGFHAPD